LKTAPIWLPLYHVMLTELGSGHYTSTPKTLTNILLYLPCWFIYAPTSLWDEVASEDVC